MEDHYSSEEEEVFFGSLAESEVGKRRRFLGENYNSPVTPRPPRFNHDSSRIQANISSMLVTSSTSTPVQSSVVSCENKQSSSVAHGSSPLKESDDDDVIILDYTKNSDSVIVLSDDDGDESVRQNGKTCTRMSLGSNEESQSIVKESVFTSDISDKSETVEVSELPHESAFSDDLVTHPVTLEDKSPSKLDIINSKIEDLHSHNSSLESFEISINKTTNESNASVCRMENSRLSPVQANTPVDVENGNLATELCSFSEASNKYVTAEVNNICNGSFLSDKLCLTESAEADNKSQKSPNNNFDNVLSHNSMLNDTETENFEITSSECYESTMEKSNYSIVQDIDDFVHESNILDKCSAPVNQDTVDNSSFILNAPHNLKISVGPSSSEVRGLNISSCIVLDSTSSAQPSVLQKNTKTNGGTNYTSAKNHANNSFDISGLNDLEFSLNGITDSILNISHGSSLPSPSVTHLTSSHVIQNPNIYEDISYDNAQLDDSTDVSNIANAISEENEDLHMSVDEVNFQQQKFSNDFGTSRTVGSSIDSSQPSEYNSCPSSHCSFNTAYSRTYCGNHSTSEQSDAFKNYRDVSCDLNTHKDSDSVSNKSDEENGNERSFEMPMQNYKNSGTPACEKSEINKEEPKAMSKLPVFQNSKSLLKPPKFYVKPETLKTTSYKFAKQISKLESEKCSSNIPRPGVLKSTVPKPLNSNKDITSDKEKKTPLVKGRTFTKTPAKATPTKPKPKTPMSTSSLTKLKTPSLSHLPVMKTPLQNIVKTPGQSIVSNKSANLSVKKTPAQGKSGIPKAVKSDSKVKKVLTPLTRCYSTERIGGGSQKNKYKNIISPIHAYISGSPPVPLRNARITNERDDPNGTRMKSQNATPLKSAPKAVQMLKYENTQEQENVNPNVLDLTRDTIPSKVFEPALQVFWKEQEEQARLPKMGEKHTKILSSIPKVKLTAHEGRVNQSPRSKGILVPNKENSPSSLIASSGSSHTDNTDNSCEGRISIRVQKTMDLP